MSAIAADPDAPQDWKRWYAADTWPMGDHLFLADVAIRLGRVLCFPWYDDLFLYAARPLIVPPHPDFFPPFVGPIGSSTKLGDPPILPGTTERPAGWTDEDEDALFEADENNHLRAAALVATQAVARSLVRLCAGPKPTLPTFGRSIADGSMVELAAIDWELDDPVSRLASCSLKPECPGALPKEHTHRIFVCRDDLETRLTEHAWHHGVSLIQEGLTPADVGVIRRPGRGSWRDLDERIVGILTNHLLSAKSVDTRRETLRQVVHRELEHAVSDRVFEKARLRVRERFPDIARPGAPIGARPTRHGG